MNAIRPPLRPRRIRTHVPRLMQMLMLLALLLPGRAAHAAERLDIAVSRTPLSLAVYIAQEKGFFAAQGLDVRLLNCVGGHRCMRQMLNGEADIATAGDMPIAINAFERSDYAVLATMVTTGDDLKLVTRARAGVRTPADLAGKRIGAVIGSASQYFLELYLMAAGVDPRQLSVVGLQPEELPEALAAGRVDAISAWEPFGWQAMKALGDGGLALPAAGAYFQTFNLVARRQLVGTRDATLVQLLRAMDRADRFIAAEPAAAREILRQRLGIEPAFVDRIWQGLGFRLALDASLVATMEGEARWARREGHAKGPMPNLGALIHAAPLKAVRPSAVGTAH